ncbi:hypothetical protein [Cysteiniphilum halobium]|uniref:hypothetical protein n=1 Tax=Cysteiniphilum halobium TaxID=2219059 RepID=UPI003F86284B
MLFDRHLFNSPQTGRRVLETNYIWLGNDVSIETPTELVPELLALPEGMILVGNADNQAQASDALINLNTEVTQLGDDVNTIQTTLGDINISIGELSNEIDNQQITLTGDIIGTGLLSLPVQTRFADNPVFHGHSITLAGGTVEERPDNPTVGMLRYCV